jgi:SH3-like domain-containing protein
VRSAPVDRDEKVIFRIHEGLKVDIAQSQPGWFEIILLDGKKGWIPYKSLLKL